MSKYFTLNEMIKSRTAKEYNINNTPTDSRIISNIEYTMDRMDAIRELWGSPIYVNSGYRCDKLNKKVGGSATSFHRKGLAMDITTHNRETNKELFNLIRAKFQFDLLIDEQDYSWIHIQFKRDKKEERNLIRRLP